MLSVKDPVPFDRPSRVVYKFSCAGCCALFTWAKQADIFQQAFATPVYGQELTHFPASTRI